MKVSLNIIRQYIDFDLPPVDELVARINAQLGGVEEVVDLSAKYKGIIIARVVSCVDHPDSDHMHVCLLDDGGVVKDVERDENGHVQVVCGAPNVREGLVVAWLPPGATVPASYGTSDPFVLGTRELRGVKSNGMIASPAELAIGDNHDGILEIDTTEWKPTDAAVEPGADFAKVFALDDTIIDIENKMFTHRPDLFGQIGIAREIAGILGHPFKSPDWYAAPPVFGSGEGLNLEVFNDASGQVARLMFVCMKDVEVKPSPMWLQCGLVAMGGKPINNIVDATNYVMLLTAQPTHAYDYDKLRGHKIGARMAREGEQVPLLNGKTYELTADDIVIADGEGAIGLGGIMGGGNSEVSPETKNIVLEVATFDMYTVRKSSMRHGVFTDALTRFNKGQSPLQNDHVLSILMASIQDVSSAKQASNVADLKAHGIGLGVAGVEVSADFINKRLGLVLSVDTIKTLLTNVECDVAVEDSGMRVKPPFWRTDVELPEDVVEEVGRLYGFDKLPCELPTRSMKPAPKNSQVETKRKITQILSGAGANEVKTYSFVHERVLTNAGQNPEHAYRLGNALSPDLQYYRLSLMPSLLDKVHMNIKAGHDNFALFEIGKTHYKGEMDANEPTVPNEDMHVAFVVAAGDKSKPQGAPYYLARRYASKLITFDEVEVQKLADFDLATDDWGQQLVAAYNPERAVVVVREGRIWGVVGEYTQAVRRAFKLPEFAAGFEVHTELVSKRTSTYKPLSRYPSVTQDISLKVAPDVRFSDIVESAESALGGLRSGELTLDFATLGVYTPEQGDSKTVTFRLKATNHVRTLTDDEVSGYIGRIAQAAAASCGAEKV